MNGLSDARWIFPAAIFLLGIAFGAGGYVAALVGARRQINGVGAKLNREIEANRQRYLRVSVTLVQLAPEEKRERIAGLLLEEKDGKP